MYQRILVPVDESNTALKAVGEAALLAKALQAELRIVTVIDHFIFNRESIYFDTDSLRHSLQQAGKALLDGARAEAEQHGVIASTQLRELDSPTDSIADMVAKEAEAWSADLIVMGSHGRRGVQRLLLGSVAEAVARQAPVPVLLLRGE